MTRTVIILAAVKRETWGVVFGYKGIVHVAAELLEIRAVCCNQHAITVLLVDRPVGHVFANIAGRIEEKSVISRRPVGGLSTALIALPYFENVYFDWRLAQIATIITGWGYRMAGIGPAKERRYRITASWI